MGERLLCKQEVDGSIPFTSTNSGGTVAVGRMRSGKRFAARLAPVIFDRVKKE